MSNINQIEQTYKAVNSINQLDKTIKDNLELSISEVLIMKMAYDSQDFVLKKDIEKALGISPSISQKATKKLRKMKYVIKDRDDDDESIVIIGMNDEMRENAKIIFEQVEELEASQNEADEAEPTNESEADDETDETDETDE